MIEPRGVGSRPMLVVLTQILLAFISLIVVYAVASAMVEVVQGHRSIRPMFQLFIGAMKVIALMTPFTLLFFGLARRRRWSWAGSILFAVVLTGWWVYLEVLYTTRPFWTLGTTLSEHIGATIGAAIIPGMFGLYALQLYRSSRVRAFLGISQHRSDGR